MTLKLRNDQRGFVMSGIALLLVLPAMLLASSCLRIIETGGETTSLQALSDKVSYTGHDIERMIEYMSNNRLPINDNTLNELAENYRAVTGLLVNLSLKLPELSVDDNTIALYHFNEGSGNTAHDSTGRNDGTIIGATWVTGKFGTWLHFSDSQYVTVPDSPSLSPSGGLEELTVEYWIYPIQLPVESLGNYPKPTNKAVASPESWFTAICRNNEDDDFDYCAWVGSEGGVSLGWLRNAAPIGQWTHLAMTYDGHALTWYVNGENRKSVVNDFGNIVNNTGSLYIGCYWANGEFRMDELRIENRALTASEIQTDYHNDVSVDVKDPRDVARFSENIVLT